jgi:hypothetical protein
MTDVVCVLRSVVGQFELLKREILRQGKPSCKKTDS